jgi:hypothetical protein
MYEKSLTVFCEPKKLQQGLIIFYFTVVIGMWVMQGILGRRFWDLVHFMDMSAKGITSSMLTSMLKYSLPGNNTYLDLTPFLGGPNKNIKWGFYCIHMFRNHY